MLAKPKPVIVDTNILFSALLNSQSSFAETLLKSEHQFFICEQILMEMFKHKEKIARLSKLPEPDLIRFYYILLKRLYLFKEDLISLENRKKAFELCQDVDETDTPHVALTLELDGLLWTGDKTLKEGLKLKGFIRFFEPKE